MRLRHHPLRGGPLGSSRSISSYHYGPADTGRTVYVQASLHADELPGMLVAHHLRHQLSALEAAGRLRGEIVVVPVANPIGLGQSVLLKHQGRFDLHSGENFNRHYPSFATSLAARLEGRLGPHASANARLIRAALKALVAEQPEDNEVTSLRKVLMSLAVEAEVVLDLHCDCSALLHLYTAPNLWVQAEPLARFMGAQACLLAESSGDNPFDEACSQPWSALQAHFGDRHPIPAGCLSATLELRGETDVAHPLAHADAAALIDFFAHRGLIDAPLRPMPPLPYDATPLTGVDVLKAPVSGVVVFVRALGDLLRRGDTVAEVIDPLSGEVHAVRSHTDGLLFAHEAQRYARAGRSLAKVAGAVPVRCGKLTSE